VRHRKQVASQRTVARVAVLQRSAVLVNRTFAVHRLATADTLLAVVAKRTRIAVVAVVPVERDHATNNGIARLVGARIPVIAVHGGTDARASLAGLLHRARIAVVALASVKRLGRASRRPLALVHCALVLVVAKPCGPGLSLRRLVRLSVAVVVDPVACFGSRDRRIAIEQRPVLAGPHPDAHAEVVLRCTRDVLAALLADFLPRIPTDLAGRPRLQRPVAAKIVAGP